MTGQAVAQRNSRWPAALVGVLLAALVLAVAAPPAEAHDFCIAHPSDPDALGSGDQNTVVCVRYNHSRIHVCDRHRDGHKAYARRTVWGETLNPIYDYNGADPGCGDYAADLDILSINVCVQYEGCGEPRSKADW